MKKSMLFYGMVTAFIFGGSAVFSQSNYSGVTGNMVSGDFDQDGLNDDIAAFNTADEIPALLLWTSLNGKLQEQAANCQMPSDFILAKSLNAKIVAGDFDNDGFVDDLASIYEIGVDKTCITVWLNKDGKFTSNRWWFGGDFDANQTSQTIVAGDFDNDGFVDDVAAFYNYDKKKTKIYVWISNGKQFAWPGTWWIGNDFDATRVQGTTVSGDFDHDGFKDDIVSLYNYSDGFCKAFVWTTNKNKFNWPYTWFSQSGFQAGKLKGNLIAGDFDQNGFDDNLAALYQNDESSSSILVFKRNKYGFDQPETWWYGNNEAITANMRLVANDLNNNAQNDQFTGLTISGTSAALITWTAENNQFTLPEEVWKGIAMASENDTKKEVIIANKNDNGLIVYPNPNNGQFSIEIPNMDMDMFSVKVSNVLGQKVLEIEAQSGQRLPMNLNDFKKGTYMVQITRGDINLRQSFVIQ